MSTDSGAAGTPQGVGSGHAVRVTIVRRGTLVVHTVKTAAGGVRHNNASYPTVPITSTYSRTLCDGTRVSLDSGGGSWRECSLVITRTPPRESNLNGNFSSGHAMNICERRGEMVRRCQSNASTVPCS